MSAKNDRADGEISVTEVDDLGERLSAMGATLPDGICILPDNFRIADANSPLLYPAHTLDVKALAKEKHLPLNVLVAEPGRVRYVENRDDTWVAPVLFFGASLLSSNANVVGVALNVLSNYIYDFLKGAAGSKKVRLTCVMEKTVKKTAVKFDFEGPVDKLPEVESVIKDFLGRGTP